MLTSRTVSIVRNTFKHISVVFAIYGCLIHVKRPVVTSKAGAKRRASFVQFKVHIPCVITTEECSLVHGGSSLLNIHVIISHCTCCGSSPSLHCLFVYKNAVALSLLSFKLKPTACWKCWTTMRISTENSTMEKLSSWYPANWLPQTTFRPAAFPQTGVIFSHPNLFHSLIQVCSVFWSKPVPFSVPTLFLWYNFFSRPVKIRRTRHTILLKNKHFYLNLMEYRSLRYHDSDRVGSWSI